MCPPPFITASTDGGLGYGFSVFLGSELDLEHLYGLGGLGLRV